MKFGIIHSSQQRYELSIHYQTLQNYDNQTSDSMSTKRRACPAPSISQGPAPELQFLPAPTTVQLQMKIATSASSVVQYSNLIPVTCRNRIIFYRARSRDFLLFRMSLPLSSQPYPLYIAQQRTSFCYLSQYSQFLDSPHYQ